YDLVWVPRPPLSRRALGLDGSVPRAVPSDLVAIALSRSVPADLAEKTVLVAIVALAVLGAHRLGRRAAGLGAVGAATASLGYAWSPYLAERLVLGHWALLLGFAALPWALDRAVSGQVVGACAWTALAAAGGANAVLVCAPAVAVVLAWRSPRWRALAGYVGFCLVTALPWAVPAVVRPGGLPSDPAGVDAFAARPDSPLGALGSLLTLGGIWNGGVVPPERHQPVVAAITLTVVAAALVIGGPVVWRRPCGPPLIAAGVLGLLLAGASGVPVVASAVRAVVLHVPGGGVLRDAQKFLAPWVLLVALGAGAAVARAVQRLHRRAPVPARVLGALLAFTPVVALPSLVWGAGGRLRPVEYPADWSRVRAALDGDPIPGSVVVLPWGPYRQFAWNGFRVGLDPVQRITARDVVMDDDLPLRDRVVAGEDPRARAVAAVLASGSDAGSGLSRSLADLGARFVVLHADAPGAVAVRTRLRGARCVVRGTSLELYALEGPRAVRTAGAPAAAVLTGDALALLAGAGAVVVALPGARRRRRVAASR
ncbi:MAG TPA: hypothetical protein VI248_16125, partial [Kineosporiaceae bacterium]